MSALSRLAFAALIATLPAASAVSENASLSISVTFGPNAEVPDPRAG